MIILPAQFIDWGLRRFETGPARPQDVLHIAGRLHSTVQHGFLSIEAVRRMQWLRVQRTLRYVYARSPFYRALFDAHGLRPEDVRAPTDLRRLPFTTPADLQDWRRFLCVPESELNAVFTTSGTTGEPKRIYYTWRELNAVINLGAIGLRLRHPGQVVALIALPQGLWIGSSEAQRIIERAGSLALPVGAGDPRGVLATMRRFAPNIVISSPSYMTALTHQAEREGFHLRLEAIFLGGEMVTEAHVARFQAFWGASVYNSYGATELGGGQTLALPDCPCLHLNELHVYAEIVNQKTGEPSDEGDLVFTTLAREAMPLVRYRIGDRARWGGCECYLPLRNIVLIGRGDDMIVAGDMNLYGHVIADAIQSVDGATGRVRLELDKVDLVDRLRVRVEGEADADKVRDSLYDVYPETRENTRNGNLLLEIETNAMLSEQIKAVKIVDRRT